jgi:hypothetical protein
LAITKIFTTPTCHPNALFALSIIPLTNISAPSVKGSQNALTLSSDAPTVAKAIKPLT